MAEGDVSPLNDSPLRRLSRPTCCVRRWNVIGAWLIVSRDVPDLRGKSMGKISATALAALGVIGLVFVVQAQAPKGSPAGRGKEEAYRPPRTAWGDPDLEGKWPSSHMAGVPLQRPESFGTRNVLTDEEFAERQAQAAQQKVQDIEDFDFNNPSIPFGQIGGGQSPPQHWLERGEPQRQASLIVDPPNGRMPALTAGAQKRAADRRAESRGPADSYTDFSLTSAASHAALLDPFCLAATTTVTRSCNRRAT